MCECGFVGIGVELKAMGRFRAISPRRRIMIHAMTSTELFAGSGFVEWTIAIFGSDLVVYADIAAYFT